MTKNITTLAIEQLTFDPINPRLPSTKRHAKEDDIITYMVINENIFDLIGSIGAQGFFPGEPLLVVKSTTDDDKYEVIEGNRRLCALKLLLNPESAKIKRKTILELVSNVSVEIPTKVEVIVFDTREEILNYLGYRHITGVDQWDSLAKARYLNQLRSYHYSEDISPADLNKRLAQIIGSRSDYVKKLINGFKLYEFIEGEEFFDIENLDEETFSFSLLTTAVSYTNISKFLEIEESEDDIKFDPKKLEELTTLIFKKGPDGVPRIPESRDLKTFSAVVDNAEALEVFRSGRPLEEAEIYTDGPQLAFEKLVREVYDKLKSASITIHKVTEFEEKHYGYLQDIFQLSRDMKNSIRNRIDDSE